MITITNIINHPFISNYAIVGKRKHHCGGYSWACIFLEETVAEFEISGSSTMNFATAHEEKRAKSVVRKGACERDSGLCRVPGERVGVGLRRLKHVQSLDVKSETFPQLWLC